MDESEPNFILDEKLCQRGFEVEKCGFWVRGSGLRRRIFVKGGESALQIIFLLTELQFR
jgi:hypothetical protein